MAGAELTYLGVVAYLAWITWNARAGTTPPVSAGIVGVAGALAAVFAIGYASLLGVPGPAPAARATGQGPVRSVLAWLNSVLTQNNLLGVGVFAYMAAGAALGITYIAHQSESPGIVKTIAVAFGGYVVAYIGRVYKDYG